MRILILTDYYPPDKLGGVGEIAKNLKQAYEDKGHKTWVLTTGKSQGEKRVIRSSKSLIRGTFFNNFKAIQLIRKHRIDVVNMHQSATSLFLFTKYVPFLYKRFPKVINSFQVSYFSEFAHIKAIKMQGQRFRPTVKEYVEKWVYSPMHIVLDFIGYIFSDEVTVVSTENKKEFEKTYKRLVKKNISIVPNGVNPTRFMNSVSQVDAKLLKKLQGKVVLLYIGVFRVRKRVFNLLFALKEVTKTNKNVVLLLVGGGRDYEAKILELIDKLGLQNNVIFIGKVPNDKIVPYLSISDVFCLLSSYEGLPVAILEAMASGTAILTSKVSGMVDLIDDAKDGFLTRVDDIGHVAEKLRLLVSRPEMVRVMGENAQNKAVGNYDWNLVADKYIGLFKS
jgi:glycosyltransferase involved in cell wall biosynthesis